MEVGSETGALAVFVLSRGFFFFFFDRYVDSIGQWMMTLMYVRTNIGNAKLAGLQEDLNLSNSEYNAALSSCHIRSLSR